MQILVDPEDEDLLSLKWHIDGKGYVVRKPWCKISKSSPKTIYMHRIILERKLGRKLLDQEICDHIDRNSFNNKRCNLRPCTHRQNCLNRGLPKNKTSRFRGVYFNKNRNKYQAQIKVNGKNKYLGIYETENDARDAYDAAAKLYNQEFAQVSGKDD